MHPERLSALRSLALREEIIANLGGRHASRERRRVAQSGLPPLAFRYVRQQPLDQWTLAGEDLAARDVGRKPFGAVDLGKRLPASALRWPFDLERVRLYHAHVDIALHCKRAHHLAARLHDFAEIDEFAVDRRTHLLREFALRHRQRILAVVVLALRDRPGAVVLARPE